MSESSQSSFQIRLQVLVWLLVQVLWWRVWTLCGRAAASLHTMGNLSARPSHTHSVVSYGTWVLRRGVRNNDTHCANKKFICVESLPLQSSPRKLFDYNLSVTKSGASHQVVWRCKQYPNMKRDDTNWAASSTTPLLCTDMHTEHLLPIQGIRSWIKSRQ